MSGNEQCISNYSLIASILLVVSIGILLPIVRATVHKLSVIFADENSKVAKLIYTAIDVVSWLLFLVITGSAAYLCLLIVEALSVISFIGNIYEFLWDNWCWGWVPAICLAVLFEIAKIPITEKRRKRLENIFILPILMPVFFHFLVFSSFFLSIYFTVRHSYQQRITFHSYTNSYISSVFRNAKAERIHLAVMKSIPYLSFVAGLIGIGIQHALTTGWICS